MDFDQANSAAQLKRRKELGQLLGLRDDLADDLSLSGRLKIIAKLKAARRVEIARGRAGSWLYDVNRHLNLCAVLRQEHEALAVYFAEGPSAGVQRASSNDKALRPRQPLDCTPRLR